MADVRCPSESCLVHREVIVRIEALEREIRAMQDNLKDKVDTDRLELTLRQLEEMKTQISKLSEADIKHSEAVAGISATLLEFKEMHREMRDDYNKLSDAYITTSNSISQLMGILKGQAEAGQLKAKEEDEIKFPWYIKILKLKPAVYFGITLLIVIACTLIFGWADIVSILKVLVAPAQ